MANEGDMAGLFSWSLSAVQTQRPRTDKTSKYRQPLQREKHQLISYFLNGPVPGTSRHMIILIIYKLAAQNSITKHEYECYILTGTTWTHCDGWVPLIGTTRQRRALHIPPDKKPTTDVHDVINLLDAETLDACSMCCPFRGLTHCVLFC